MKNNEIFKTAMAIGVGEVKTDLGKINKRECGVKKEMIMGRDKWRAESS